MNPNQPGSPAPGSNPYEFITNPSQPGKRPSLGGNPLLKRVMVVVGGAVILMIIVSIAISLLGSGGTNIDALKSLTAKQQEIVRVADMGVGKAQDINTRSLALTAKLSASTQQQELLAYLEQQDVKPTKLELASEEDSDTDVALETAATSNRFDEAFNQILIELLTDYANSLSSTYEATSGENAKAVLSQSYASIATLLNAN